MFDPSRNTIHGKSIHIDPVDSSRFDDENQKNGINKLTIFRDFKAWIFSWQMGLLIH
jgi:hypothetical protein